METTSDRRPNVVVVVLDSVRYDRTTLGGHDRDTTPELARIADQPDGASFETAIAHANYTGASSASILTGTYPVEHRIGLDATTLDPAIPRVASAFRDAGYATACASNNAFVSADTGMDRGFDRFVLLPTSPVGILRTVGVGSTLRFLGNIREHSAGFQRDVDRHSGAFLLTELVHRLLDDLADRSDPFFLYVHYNEPHRAYHPPLGWLDTYADSFEMSARDAAEFGVDVHRNLEDYVAAGCPFTDDEWAALLALYDTEIRYTDSFVGEVFDRLDGEFGDTVFVATADHGEHFGEGGALAHGYRLDDAVLRVPLVTRGLDVEPTRAPVQHTDVVRTALGVAGAETDFVDGIDLREETREFAVSQAGETSLAPLFERDPKFDGARFFPGARESIPVRTALRTDTHRYVSGADGTRVLYRLPDETRDVSEDETGVAADLASKLEEWLASRRAGTPDRTTPDDGLSEDVTARLKRMGYLEDDL